MRLLFMLLLSLLFTLTNLHHALANSVISQPTIEIAPVDQALTFARTNDEHGKKTILVTSFKDNIISGHDLSNAFDKGDSDAIDLFHRYGYEHIRNMLQNKQRFPIIQVPLIQLDIPVDLADKHIAVGTNYREHAEETDVTKTPFLFSKRVIPTRWNAGVTSQSRALDYEAEVAMVALNDIKHSTAPYQIGLMLCNDLSDREILMHNVDPKNIESGKGFAQGKSAPGLLPVGNLFLIPNATDPFLERLTIQLSVNDVIRQQAKVKQLIWQRQDVFNEIWRNNQRVWQFNGYPIQLLSDPNTIPKRTLILTGTPAGTVFQGIPFMTKLKGVGQWLISGMKQSVQYYVVENYLAEYAANYLQNRDQVTVVAPFLGTLSNRISKTDIVDAQASNESLHH